MEMFNQSWRKIMSQNPPEGGLPPSMPPWVKVFGIILIGLVLVVIVMHLMGNDLSGLHHLP
jgi:hypothetical protein